MKTDEFCIQPLLKSFISIIPSYLKIKPPLGARVCTQAVTHSTIGPLDRNLRPKGFAHASVSSADHPERQPWNTDAMAPGGSPNPQVQIVFVFSLLTLNPFSAALHIKIK